MYRKLHLDTVYFIMEENVNKNIPNMANNVNDTE